MLYSAAVYAFVLLAGSASAFSPAGHSICVARCIVKMMGSDPWFSNAVVTNTAIFEHPK